MIPICTPKRQITAALTLLLATALQTFADSTNLIPVADTSLFEYTPTNNMGALVDLPLGTIDKGSRSRLLLRFDVASAVPPGATISSATLTLQVVSAKDVNPGYSNFELHRMLVSWVEGTKLKQTGQPASPGETTWNARLSPSTAWSQPGAAAPVDFTATVSGSYKFLGPGGYTYASNSNLVADVQFWLDNPQRNYGWIVISDQEATKATARRVDSRENHVHPPKLSIEYTAPHLLQIDSISHIGDNVRLLFSMQSNQVYTVQYKTSVVTQAWSDLTQVGPSQIATTAVIETSITNNPCRLYRIQTSP